MENEVRHNPGLNRYEIAVKGFLCILEYVIKGQEMVITHTFVPLELRGQGLADKVVRAALADARAKGLKVVPACSYVAIFMQRHVEFKDLLAQ